MNPMKSTLLIALVSGMILLAVLGFNLTTVHAHGHGGRAAVMAAGAAVTTTVNMLTNTTAGASTGMMTGRATIPTIITATTT